MSGISYYTKEVLEQLRADLHKMKTVERTAASKAIAEAREKGDLRENANMTQQKRRRDCWKQKYNDWKANW